MSSSKIRIDKLLIDRGLAPSRERAQALILAGVVYVGSEKVTKASAAYAPDAPVQVRGEDHPYVSRGGVKLAGALDHFQIPVAGKICVDVGASTGGFTDCLLQREAKNVYAVDVGYGQLAWKIRQDPRVTVMERKNIRSLKPGEIPEPVELIVVDVSFVSLEKVLPPLIQSFPGPLSLLALVKPQFEAGPGKVPKGGVIQDELLRQKIVQRVWEAAGSWGVQRVGLNPSVLKGTDGNQEYFLFLRKL